MLFSSLTKAGSEITVDFMKLKILPGIVALLFLATVVSPCVAGVSAEGCPVSGPATGCKALAVNAPGMTCCCDEPRSSTQAGPTLARCTAPVAALTVGVSLAVMDGVDTAPCSNPLQSQTPVPLYIMHSALLR